MAFGDRLKAVVFTEYTADISKHERAIKKLSGEEKKRAKAALDDAKDVNSAIDDQIAKYTALAAAAVATFKAGSAGLEEYRKQHQLAAATVGVNLGGLQQATRGLVSDTELLEFAASSMNGTFKLSQQEMQGALEGVLALRNQGKPLTETLERVGQAVREGNVEPLKELGIIIKGVEGDSEDGVQAVLEALNAEAAKMGGNFDQAGDGIGRASVKMSNAMSDLKQALGRIVVAMEPLIAAIAEIAEKVAWVVEEASKVSLFGDDSLGGNALAEQERRQREFLSGPGRALNAMRGAQQLRGVISGVAGGLGGLGTGGSMPAAANGNARRGAGGFDISGSVADPANRNVTFQGMATDANTLRNQKRASAIEAEAKFHRQQFRAAMEQAQVGLSGLEEQLGRLALERDRNILSQVFGTPAEVEAMTMAITALGGAMDGFVGAFGKGVDALITGSDSFANAFKNAIAESARGLAVEFAMQSLRHSLFAVGSLAFGDFRGAAQHGKAAAGYGVGAVAIGGLARGLGAGQVQTPRTTGATGVGASGGASGAANGNRTTIHLISPLVDQLPPGQREAMYRRRAERSGVTIPGAAVING